MLLLPSPLPIESRLLIITAVVLPLIESRLGIPCTSQSSTCAASRTPANSSEPRLFGTNKASICFNCFVDFPIFTRFRKQHSVANSNGTCFRSFLSFFSTLCQPRTENFYFFLSTSVSSYTWFFTEWNKLANDEFNKALNARPYVSPTTTKRHFFIRSYETTNCARAIFVITILYFFLVFSGALLLFVLFTEIVVAVEFLALTDFKSIDRLNMMKQKTLNIQNNNFNVAFLLMRSKLTDDWSGVTFCCFWFICFSSVNGHSDSGHRQE